MEKSLSSPDHQRLLNLLRTVRQEADLPQTGLADLLGKPQSFVSKYETGERRLDLLELRVICDAVGISLVEFVRRFEEEVGRTGRRFPRCVSPVTLWRWCTTGVRGRHLEAALIGRQWVSSVPAVERFVDALAKDARVKPGPAAADRGAPKKRTARARKQSVEKARRRCKRAGLAGND